MGVTHHHKSWENNKDTLNQNLYVLGSLYSGIYVKAVVQVNCDHDSASELIVSKTLATTFISVL